MNTVPKLAQAPELNHLLLPASMKLARLEELLQVAYQHLGRAKDATFELIDAILLNRNIYCLADFEYLVTVVFNLCFQRLPHLFLAGFVVVVVKYFSILVV
ncbi:hypothetical protein [Nostoc sp. NMS9]|uniref:hypothetical protein n=1 Tax=Nostoc sp. NMS9 TaxID=2815393 RepID=UPI0025E484C7|nr:hypothetical protein [Nostoc sp. NMS9]MBN3940256.1 hypothetical protein [Nostoc sp. NMS9]